ncbi:MAG: 50S ribosomal protein L25 [Nitrospira sp.]|nr:50S ribosomal protein L25 [Nitrospira sp.]
MERILLNANMREESGKGVARSLRRSGRIPAVLYSKGESTPIILDPFKIQKMIRLGHAESTLIDLKIENAAEASDRIAILRDYQTDPLTGLVIHADLFEVSMDEKIRVTVPVELTGETPVGVKRDGGLLQLILREIELECLPLVIPDNISVDASRLTVGESIHIRDIQVGEGVKIVLDPDQVVLTIASPVSQEKLDQLLTTPAPGEATKEPELLKKPAKEGEKAEEKEGK